MASEEAAIGTHLPHAGHFVAGDLAGTAALLPRRGATFSASKLASSQEKFRPPKILPEFSHPTARANLGASPRLQRAGGEGVLVMAICGFRELIG